MTHTDHIVRALIQDADLRAIAVVATGTAREAVTRHQAAPTSAEALAQAVAGGLLLARLHKSPRRVNLQVEVDGPLRGVVVDADAEGRVRAFPREPNLALAPVQGTALAAALGDRGLVNVLREMNPGEWYRGTVALPERSLERGIESYLATSEQVDSVLDLTVRRGPEGELEAVVGVLFQRLPDGNPAALEAVRARLEEGFVAEWLDGGGELAGGALLDAIMGGPEGKGGDNLQFFDRAEVGFHCGCTRERVESALVVLGPEELEAMADEEGRAELTCDFCREVYEVPEATLRALAQAARAQPAA